MFCTTSKTEGEVGAVKLVQAPSNSLLTVPRQKFCCGSLLPVFGVRVSVTFHLTCVRIILARFRLLSGHLWEIAAHSVDHMLSLYFDYL